MTALYPHVVAYSRSMGGYGAIRLGSRVGVQVALAISPQFSIDSAVAPFEPRWAGDSARIDFRSSGMLATVSSPRPMSPTIRTTSMPGMSSSIGLIPRSSTSGCSIAAIPPRASWVDTDILQQALLDLCRGTFDIPVLRAQVRQAQHSSAILYPTLPYAAVTCRAACGCHPKPVRCREMARLCWSNTPSPRPTPTSSALAIFDKAWADDSINAQMRYR